MQISHLVRSSSDSDFSMETKHVSARQDGGFGRSSKTEDFRSTSACRCCRTRRENWSFVSAMCTYNADKQLVNLHDRKMRIDIRTMASVNPRRYRHYTISKAPARVRACEYDFLSLPPGTN